MNAGALGGGQVIDAPPTHLEQYKRYEQYPQSELRLVFFLLYGCKVLS
jgi:hypothetical protein